MTVEETLASLVEAVKRFLKQVELAYANNDETALLSVLYAQMFGRYAGWCVNADGTSASKTANGWTRLARPTAIW